MSSQTTDKLIQRYEIRVIEAGCTSGSGRWGVLVIPQGDISEVFPYLNAAFHNTSYDHANKTLIIRDQRQVYAFRPDEIRIARTDDTLQAAADIVERVNAVWQKRETITPNFIDKTPVSVIDIFKLLPGTNCKKCGLLTCLAFAAGLRQGTADLEGCPYLSHPENAENRQKLSNLFVSE